MTFPRISASITFAFDLDEEGLFYLRPDWFDENGEFIATIGTVLHWINFSGGKDILTGYFGDDVEALVQQGDQYAMDWVIEVEK